MGRTVKDIGAELLEKRRLQQDRLEKAKGTDGAGYKFNDQELSEFKATNAELEVLQKDYDAAAEIENIAEQNRKSIEELEEPSNPLNIATKGYSRDARGQVVPQKSLGEMLIESKQYKEYCGTNGAGSVTINFEGEAAIGAVKTLMTTGTGWAPANPRTDIVVPMAMPMPELEDLLPHIQSDLTAWKYMEQTTATNAAATRAEGGTAAESALALTERTAIVYNASHFIPLTDEQIADVPQVMGMVNTFMGYGLKYMRESKILTGPGSSDHTGIMNVSGVQTYVKPAEETIPDAILRSMTKVRRSGNGSYGSSTPNLLSMNPLDWETVLLMKTTDGAYLFGGPNGSQATSMWGVRPTTTENQTQGTLLVGDSKWCLIVDKQEIKVELGYLADDFKNFRKAVRGSTRFAVVVYRPGAFCKVTGL